ncbi:MAG: alpha/beta hydrolase [Anaerolineales bacterium]|nr:alpha/beta hydrolase [Anaerolineales bacterium]MCX7609158.1 alpha/beta hydrolase [Anaerolineales bacterium]
MSSFRTLIIERIMRDFRNTLLSDVPFQVRRQRLDAVARRGIRVPRDVVTRPIVTETVPCEWIEPKETNPGCVVLYLHGGGYVMGSSTTHRGLVARIAKAGRCCALVADYRLAPEHSFPASLEDALTAYRFLLKAGYRPNRIAIGGDSAGGGLSLATALSLRDQSLPLPGALFLISPWTDLTFSGESVHTRAHRDPLLKPNSGDWMIQAYAGDWPLTHPYLSPLFGDHHGLPPTLIQVGSEEILFDDSARLEKRMQEAGVQVRLEVWEGMWHVFHAFAPYVPEALEAIEHIGQFLRRHIGSEQE